MCGIAGIWHFNTGQTVSLALIRQMTATLRHRGPDDEGYVLIESPTARWEQFVGDDTRDKENIQNQHRPSVALDYDLAFGFRRLAILDLSPAGRQPMRNADGSLWIVFNGEIYNYIELREELSARGYTFRTGTDTEVILAAYAEWGEACLTHFNGMWAFALWDSRRQKLFCARDRFGIKPFYYFWDGELFAFASEIKALLSLPNFIPAPNDALIYDYLSYNHLDHTEETFFQGIKQLPSAHFLTLETDLTLKRYWDIDLNASLQPLSEALYAEQFYTLFEDAVRLHLRSDVPIGTCLSGGLDSSAIVCIANRLLFSGKHINPVLVGAQQKTFSSCSENPQFDERPYIQQVLDLTNAEPNFIFPDPHGLLDDLSRLIWHQDEPFGSLSIYAQWCIMRAAAERGVKVLLDGQGADEIVGGYHLYFDYFWGSLFRRGQWTTLTREMAAYRARFGASPTQQIFRMLRPFAPPLALRAARHLKRGGTLGTQTLGVNPDFGRTFQHRVFETVRGNRDPFTAALYDNLFQLSLPKLLRFEDRNSMAFSIEARVPFLDYRLVEYAFALPAAQKINNAVTKVVLRNALKGVLPEPVRLRTDKMGFVTPERAWLAQELSAWAQEIVHSESFKARGYFNVPEIEKALIMHQRGKSDLTNLAWRWLNLELWFRQMIDGHTQQSAFSP